MDWLHTQRVLTHAAVLRMLQAAVAAAEQLAVPQCVVVVDAGGEPLGEIRMTGAKFLSRRSALAKASTAASIRAPSASVPEAVRGQAAAATGGAVTGLPGGLPVVFDGEVVGAVGVGSGTGDQDVAVAQAALAAIGAAAD